MKSLEELPIGVISIDDIKGIHPIANKNPSMGETDFELFKKNVKELGYITTAIVIFRGKVVDGRHRLKASEELGFTEIPCRIIPNNTKLTDIQEKLIMTQEVRRHQTPTQRTCSAVLEYYRIKESGQKTTQQIVATTNEISVFLLKNALFIYKNNREIFDALLNGNSIKVGNNFSTRLDVIASDLREKTKEAISKEPTVTVDMGKLENTEVSENKKKFIETIKAEASKLGMTPKEIADTFYKLSKEG